MVRELLSHTSKSDTKTFPSDPPGHSQPGDTELHAGIVMSKSTENAGPRSWRQTAWPKESALPRYGKQVVGERLTRLVYFLLTQSRNRNSGAVQTLQLSPGAGARGSANSQGESPSVLASLCCLTSTTEPPPIRPHPPPSLRDRDAET